MDDLLSQWREKQYEIASKSKVLDDDQTAMRNCPNTVEFSHLPQTIQDKLIGGVDVSFGDGDSAIAVYVITRNYQVLYTDTLLYNISQPYVSSYLGKSLLRTLIALGRCTIKQLIQSVHII